MRAFRWVLVGGVALACGGSTTKHPLDDAATGGKPEPTVGGTTAVMSAGGAGPSVGGSTALQAGTSVGVNAGAPETVSAAGEAAVGGAAGAAGSPPETFDVSCPAALPAPRGGCTPGLSCNYGADLRPWCRPSARCEPGGWQLETPNCPALAVCEKIPGFAEKQACEPAARPDPCQNESSHLCRCATLAGASTWRCAPDIAASFCPQQVVPNEGQPCGFNGNEIDCYYTLCPTAQQPFFVATCTAAGWHYRKTCNP